MVSEEEHRRLIRQRREREVVQLFQQTGMVGKLNEEVRGLLNRKGAEGFGSARSPVVLSVEHEGV